MQNNDIRADKLLNRFNVDIDWFTARFMSLVPRTTFKKLMKIVPLHRSKNTTMLSEMQIKRQEDK